MEDIETEIGISAKRVSDCSLIHGEDFLRMVNSPARSTFVEGNSDLIMKMRELREAIASALQNTSSKYGLARRLRWTSR